MVDWCCNILFCTNDARAFQPFGCLLSDLQQVGSAVLNGHWLGLGRFDHMFVTLARESDDLLKAEKTVQSCTHANSHWSCFGRVIAASWDYGAAQWPTAQGPILGVCGIKLAHALRASVDDLNRVGECIADELKPLGGQWLVASTTGWEDLMLLYWADEFQTLSQAVGKVRGLRIDALTPKVEGVHAVLTTCTVPGIELPVGSFSTSVPLAFNSKIWVEKIRPRLNEDMPLDWALRFELRPGHFDAFERELKSRSESLLFNSRADLQYRNVLGQYDLRVQAAGSTHGAWLEYLGQVALPVAAKVGSLVRSMETHLHIEVPSFSEGNGAESITPISTANYAQNTLEPIEKACGRSGVAAHTLEMLRATHSRFIALQEDDLQHGTFRTVENLFVRLAEGLGEKEGDHKSLASDLPYWLYLVERSLADRYRGTYPLGEAVVPRLGTYQASHHGFLAAADCLAQEAFDLARVALNAVMRDCPLPSVTVCTFIGSSPSPNAQTFLQYMRSGFIELPAIMIFRLHELWILLHEVGHIFIDVAAEHFQVVYHGIDQDQSKKIRSEIQEILADLFACCAGFGGNVMAFGAKRIQVQKNYLPDPNDKYASSTQFVSLVRLMAVHWLVTDELDKQDASAALSKFKESAKSQVKQELMKAGLVGDEQARAQEAAEKAVAPIADAVWALARKHNSGDSGHRAIINAIKSLRQPEGAPRVLNDLQVFLRAEGQSLARDFHFIERIMGQ